MAHQPIPTRSYVLVICQHEGRFILVDERKESGLYLPAGAVELGETISEAAIRETLEEAGVLIRPTSVLGIDHSWSAERGEVAQKLRFFVEAELVGDPTPKTWADKHSLGARWVSAEEATGLRFRHPEALEWIRRAQRSLHALPIQQYRGMGLYRTAIMDYD